MKAGKSKKLTDKQKRFCEEYLVDSNATQAAIRSGYSEKTARSIAQENLTKPDIREYLRQLRQKQSDRTQISADRVLKEVSRIAFFDIRKAFDGAGNLLDPKDMDDETAATIASIETLYTRVPGKKEVYEGVKKIRAWDKKGALELLMKHLQLFDPESKPPVVPGLTMNFFNMTTEQINEWMDRYYQEARRANRSKS